jgi:hypothetical protein
MEFTICIIFTVLSFFFDERNDFFLVWVDTETGSNQRVCNPVSPGLISLLAIFMYGKEHHEK